MKKGKAWVISGKVRNLMDLLARHEAVSSDLYKAEALASKAAGMERDLSRGITPWLSQDMRATAELTGAPLGAPGARRPFARPVE